MQTEHIRSKESLELPELQGLITLMDLFRFNWVKNVSRQFMICGEQNITILVRNDCFGVVTISKEDMNH